MVKNLIDLEIKRFDDEDFSVDCHPEDRSNHYYLRFRFFLSDGEGAEFEFWFPTLTSCIFRLKLLLNNYLFHL